MCQCLHDSDAQGRELSENPWRLNGEDPRQMYSKHLSV